MHARSSVVFVALSALVAGACAHLRAPDTSPGSPPEAAPPASGYHGGEIIFNEGDLTTGGSLLDALRGRVSSMRVSRVSGCNQVSFRGPQSISGSSEAQVWIDGQSTSDSCILDLIRRWDVGRVEIYPSGLVPHRGYPASATGSILVFMKQAES